MAVHLNEYFSPFQPLKGDDITFAAGVTALNEACAFVTCDADSRDAIMLGKYNYGAFPEDMTTRTGLVITLSFSTSHKGDMTLTYTAYH